jgi:hypothetical protein
MPNGTPSGTPDDSGHIEFRRRLERLVAGGGPYTPKDRACIKHLLDRSARVSTPEVRQDFEESLKRICAQAAPKSLEWYERWLEEVRLCQSMSPTEFGRRCSLSRCRYVYLMRAENLGYKIGESHQPGIRRKQIQKKEKRTVELITKYPTVVAPRLERMLHRHFRHVHFRDEWFNLPEQVTTPKSGFWVMAAVVEERLLELEVFRLLEIIKHLQHQVAGC